jgi:hypothetical protein
VKFRYQKLPFGIQPPHRPLRARPLIPVRLSRGGKSTPSWFYALLDSGADRVLMPGDLAAELGITDLRSGRSEPIVGVGNTRLDVHYHPVTVEVAGEGRSLLMDVGFAQVLTVPLLGRSFFGQYRAVVFNERANEVELKP